MADPYVALGVSRQVGAPSGINPFTALGVDPAAVQSAPPQPSGGRLPDWAIHDTAPSPSSAPAPARAPAAEWWQSLPPANGQQSQGAQPAAPAFNVERLLSQASRGELPSPSTRTLDSLPQVGAQSSGSTRTLDSLPPINGAADQGAKWWQALPPAQQAPDAVASMLSLGIQGKLPAPPPPPDKSTLSGIGNAIPSGLYAGVASIPNAPTALWNLGARGVRALGGPDLSLEPPINPNPTNYQPRGTAERATYAGAEAVGSLPAMAVGGEIAAPLLRAGGQIASRAVPATVAPVVRGAANMGADVAQSFADMPMNSPGLATAATNAARFAPAPLRPAIVKLGEVASQAPVGVVPQSTFVGGAAGQAAAENVPEPYQPLVNVGANLLAGGGLAAAETALAAGGRAAARTLGGAGIGPKTTIYGPEGQPLARVTETQANTVAGRLAQAAGGDLDTARRALNNAPEQLVEGSQPTTAQIAPVPGFVGLEQAHRVATPEPFNARAAAQNSARLDVVQGLAPESANPTAVGQWFRSQLAAADQAGQIGLASRASNLGAQVEALGGRGTPEGYAAPVQAAVEGVQAPLRAQAAADVATAQAGRGEALAGLPGGRVAVPGGATVPEQYGADIRAQAMQGRAAVSAQVERLKGLIDPEGDAGVAAAPFRQAVEDVYANRPQAEAPPVGEERAIRGIAGSWGDLAPLSEVFALRQRVGDAISDMLPPGATATQPVRRLQQVKGALDDALANVAAHQAAFEAQEVQAGRMGHEESILGRLQQESGYDGASPMGTPPAGSGGVLREQRAGGGSTAGASASGASGASQGRYGTLGGNRPVATAPTAPGRKPESLIDFLIARGGVQDQGGDLRAIGADTLHHQQGGRLVNPRGVPLDYAREAAEEAGFLRPGSTTADLLNAIADHVSGRPVYRISEQAEGDIRARTRQETERQSAAYQHARDVVEMAEADAGARLSNDEIDHAARLVIQGVHPQQALIDAVRPGEDVALARNAQAAVFTHPGMPGAREVPLPLSGGGAGPSSLRPMTAEQLGAYRDYIGAAQSLKQKFDNGAVGDVLSFGEHRTAAEAPGLSRARGGFQKPDAEVVGTILRKGVTEADATRQALNAGIKPETLTGALADELRARAVKVDGSLDPKAYAQFRRDHAGALHVFPDTLKAFDSLAHAQATVDAAHSAAAAIEAAHPLRGVQQSAVMGRYWRPGDEGAEAVRQLLRDTGNDPAARAALDQYAVYRMRDDSVVSPDGTVDAKALDRYTAKYARALSERPELSRQLSSVQSAQRALDDATAAHQAALREYENGAARNFLHDDPLIAVRKAFSSGNPADTFAKLASMVRGSSDAEAGLRRAVVDFILEKARSATPAGETEDFLKADVFRRWIRTNSKPLKELFGGQGVQNLDMVAADLRRGAYSGVSAGGSPTATYAAAGKRHNLVPGGHVGGGVGVTVLTLIGERLGEHVGEHGLIGALALPALGVAVHSLRQAAVRTINDVERLAMLHPSIARELMARVRPDGRVGPLAQRRLGAAIQATLGVGAVQQSIEAKQ